MKDQQPGKRTGRGEKKKKKGGVGVGGGGVQVGFRWVDQRNHPRLQP